MTNKELEVKVGELTAQVESLQKELGEAQGAVRSLGKRYNSLLESVSRTTEDVRQSKQEVQYLRRDVDQRIKSLGGNVTGPIEAAKYG